MHKIDVFQLERDLQKNMERRNYEEPICFEESQNNHPVFKKNHEYNEEKFQKSFDYINNNWQVINDTSLSTGNFFERIIKRIVKKATDFIINPILCMQNTYNAQNAKCVGQLREYMEEIERCKEKIKELEIRINELENRDIIK